MRYLKIPIILLWRAWFYVLMTITVLLMVPFLLVLTAKESYYPIFWKLVRVWAHVILYGMGFRVKTEFMQKVDSNKSYMFCPNHTSMMDPFILIVLNKSPIVFVGKQEYVKIPIFGFFYKRAVIMVKRESSKSRKRVYELAKNRLSNGTSVVIFPEGKVPEEDVVLSDFKNGAFSLAIEHQIPIVPQIYYDCKRLFSWDFLKGGPGVFRVKQLPFIETRGLDDSSIQSLKAKLYGIMYKDLIQDSLYMEDTNREK